jgi:hypothetical protein
MMAKLTSEQKKKALLALRLAEISESVSDIAISENISDLYRDAMEFVFQKSIQNTASLLKSKSKVKAKGVKNG